MSLATLKTKVEQLIEKAQSGNSELADAYYAMTSYVTTISFKDSTELEWVLPINTSKITNFAHVFSGCKNLKRIDFINTLNGTNFQNMFFNCSSLETIPQLKVSNGTVFQNMFFNCFKLVNVSFVENSIKSSIQFAHSPLLSVESIQSIINGLATVEIAQTLTLHTDVKAKLTESQIAQITSKNWNLA